MIVVVDCGPGSIQCGGRCVRNLKYVTAYLTVLMERMNAIAVSIHVFLFIYICKQESRAAARKPRDAASVLFGRSSPTTFLTSIRPAMLRKPRFRAPNMLAQNTI